MASTIIHLAIAKKVLERGKVENPKDYYLGSVAPDISKQIGQSKESSHFLINTENGIPNINLFIKRYPTFKYNSFNLGYFTHLYTDKCWHEDFLPTFVKENKITLLDGTTIEATKEEMLEMLYSDYTNINTKIIEEYDLDLSLFYEDFIVPDTNLKEVPIQNLDILLNKAGIIIENSKVEKAYTFDFEIINKFIQETANKIIKELKKY